MPSNIAVGLRTKDLSAARLRYIAQLGVRDVFVDLRTPEEDETVHAAESQESGAVEGLTIRTDAVPTVEAIRTVKERLAAFDLTFAGVHTLRPAMYDAIASGTEGAETQLGAIEALVRTLGAADIDILGYQWMPDSVQRTDPAFRTRGGARATAFDLAAYEESIDEDHSEAAFWTNYERFLDRILPVAEEAGVTLALHPADPPSVPKLNGIPRLFRAPAAFERALTYRPSPNHGLKCCLGCFSEMGEDVPAIIERFGDAISFVHFRDVVGSMPAFHEAFLDDPATNFDARAAMAALRDVGFEGAVLPDHVPRMEDDTQWGHRGRGFTVGYLQGLIDGTAQP